MNEETPPNSLYRIRESKGNFEFLNEYSVYIFKIYVLEALILNGKLMQKLVYKPCTICFERIIMLIIILV